MGKKEGREFSFFFFSILQSNKLYLGRSVLYMFIIAEDFQCKRFLARLCCFFCVCFCFISFFFFFFFP